MTIESCPDTLRAEMKALARRYFESHHAPKAFVPGQTYIPVTAKRLDAEDLEALLDASLDLWLTAGRFANQLEAELPARLGCSPKALLVNSGSSANLLAVSSLGSPLMSRFGFQPMQAGDEIITAAVGFPTTVNPIFQNGWKPVFVDVDEATLNVLPEKVMEARSSRTRAVILAHTLGNPFRVQELSEWCKREGLFLIEDCCDALGSTVNGAPVGSFGDYATLSFYPAHHITTGEGGAVMSRSGRLRRVAESMRDWGRDCWCEPGHDNTCLKRYAHKLGELPEGYDHKFTYSSVGYNLKMTDMQAAIGVSQLRKVDEFIAARRANWRALSDGVVASPSLSRAFRVVQPTQGTEPSWFGFPLICADFINRERVVSLLEERRIGTRLVFAGNIVRQPAYLGLDYRTAGDLTHSDRIMRKAFWLGVHPNLTPDHLSYILEQLEAVAKVAEG